MWIKLISPRITKRPMDSDWKTRMSPPLALLTLAALTPEKHRVTLSDENVEWLRTGDAPDLVGISVKADTFYRACEIAAAYRQRAIPVVMGGIHATACPDDCAPHADAIVIGEAESVWNRIVEDAEAKCLKTRYRAQGGVDIASVPVPRWSLLNEKAYLFTNTIYIGRGCHAHS